MASIPALRRPFTVVLGRAGGTIEGQAGDSNDDGKEQYSGQEHDGKPWLRSQARIGSGTGRCRHQVAAAKPRLVGVRVPARAGPNRRARRLRSAQHVRNLGPGNPDIGERAVVELRELGKGLLALAPIGIALGKGVESLADDARHGGFLEKAGYHVEQKIILADLLCTAILAYQSPGKRISGR